TGSWKSRSRWKRCCADSARRSARRAERPSRADLELQTVGQREIVRRGEAGITTPELRGDGLTDDAQERRRVGRSSEQAAAEGVEVDREHARAIVRRRIPAG